MLAVSSWDSRMAGIQTASMGVVKMVVFVVDSAYAWRLESSRFDSVKGYIC